MEPKETLILNEYAALRPSLLVLEDLVYTKINSFITQNDLFVMDISHRTKTISSLKGKLEKKFGKYSSLYDITDLCGFRIICYFADTIDEIINQLKKTFEIDYANSIDKGSVLQATEFGYISVHYICSLKEEDIKNHPEFKNIRFEVQIRSVLQHAWAEIEHDLGYKSDFGVPRPIRREFSRVASLLEVADNQFIELRKNTIRYEEDIKNMIKNNTADDIPIDRVSLREYIYHNQLFISYLREISSVHNIEIITIDPENYLTILQSMNIMTIGDFVEFFKRNKESAQKFIVDTINKFELDIGTTNMLLRYLCKAEMIRLNYSPEQIKKILN